MAAQQTLKASPMQACRSSDVSATAVEDKKAITRAAVGGASVFIVVHAFKTYSPTVWRERRAFKEGSGLSRGKCGVLPRLMTASSRAPLAPLEPHHR